MNFILFYFIALKLLLAYKLLSQQSELKAQLQRYSFKPSVISYQVTKRIANQHQDFLQLENKIKDYANLIILDCVKNLESKDNKQIIPDCKDIVEKKVPILHVYGFRPIDYLVNIRSHLIELAPELITFKNEKTIKELVSFAESLVPNYLKKLYTEKDLLDFLNNGNHLLPKLILCTQSEDDQLFIRKLSILFYGRVQFAQVMVYQNFDIKHKVGIFKYDFQNLDFEKQYLQYKLNNKQYENIKKFIEKFASPKPIRHLYFTLGLRIYQPINYADLTNFTKIKYDSDIWTLIYEGPKQQGQQVLQKYRQKYTNYLKYMLLETNDDTPKLYLSHKKNKLLSFEQVSLQYENIVNFQAIRQQSEQLLHYQSVVLFVEPKLDYLCSIENLKLFKNILFCFVLKQQNIIKIKQMYEILQTQDLALVIKKDQDNQFKAVNLNNFTFQVLVRQIYSSTNQKITFLATQFLKNPILPLPINQSYSRICGQKCIIYLYDTQNPNKIEQKLLKQLALQYNEWLRFVKGDFRCNSDLFSLMKKGSSVALILYQKGNYYHLKQKISMNSLSKLYKTYKRQNLKFKQLPGDLRTNQICEFEIGKEKNKSEKKATNEQKQKQEQL